MESTKRSSVIFVAAAALLLNKVQALPIVTPTSTPTTTPSSDPILYTSFTVPGGICYVPADPPAPGSAHPATCIPVPESTEASPGTTDAPTPHTHSLEPPNRLHRPRSKSTEASPGTTDAPTPTYAFPGTAEPPASTEIKYTSFTVPGGICYSPPKRPLEPLIAPTPTYAFPGTAEPPASTEIKYTSFTVPGGICYVPADPPAPGSAHPVNCVPVPESTEASLEPLMLPLPHTPSLEPPNRLHRPRSKSTEASPGTTDAPTPTYAFPGTAEPPASNRDQNRLKRPLEPLMQLLPRTPYLEPAEPPASTEIKYTSFTVPRWHLLRPADPPAPGSAHPVNCIPVPEATQGSDTA
ncbi:hypothetical protein BC829DRAFT_434457 [Chytridium lagenaria]|nr:hypothetical protein BC829DRAFT_434457 [Chytridium lagenaria]